jgi:hypothetical protein
MPWNKDYNEHEWEREFIILLSWNYSCDMNITSSIEEFDSYRKTYRRLGCAK